MRLRIRFSKLGKVRWTSHRDLARMWERAFRRVQLPLAYSEGFSPRPKVSFGLALPTGCESVAEYLDVGLRDVEGVDVASLVPRLSAALPLGVDATAAALLGPGAASLQEDVTSCSWRWLAVAAPGHDQPSPDRLTDVVAALLAAPSLVVSRARKGVDVPEDVRPGIKQLKAAGTGRTGGVWLEAELATQPRSVRPAEVLAALGPGLEGCDVRRTHQWILRHGARLEPLAGNAPTGATEAPHAMERAS